MRNVYVVGSLHNPLVTEVANRLREAGHEVFDDWHAPGPDTDSFWREYEEGRGRTYIEALAGKHAKNVFDFDMVNLHAADTVVLILPTGKSAHMEIGYAVGVGKDCYIILDGEAHWEVMYRLVKVLPSVESLLETWK